jgi:hypothetical protein
LDSAAKLLGVSDLGRLTEGIPLSRRRALAWLGGLGLAAVIPGCADDDPSTAPSTSAAQDTADCVLMPELTEGPYYLDLAITVQSPRTRRHIVTRRSFSTRPTLSSSGG